MANVRIQCQNCATAMETDGGNDEGVETMWCPKCHPGFCPRCEREDSAAPVEPPVLSREFLDSLIEKIWTSDARPLGNLPWGAKDVYDDAFTLLRDAILESLSQEVGDD